MQIIIFSLTITPLFFSPVYDNIVFNLFIEEQYVYTFLEKE